MEVVAQQNRLLLFPFFLKAGLKYCGQYFLGFVGERVNMQVFENRDAGSWKLWPNGENRKFVFNGTSRPSSSSQRCLCLEIHFHSLWIFFSHPGWNSFSRRSRRTKRVSLVLVMYDPWKVLLTGVRSRVISSGHAMDDPKGYSLLFLSLSCLLIKQMSQQYSASSFVQNDGNKDRRICSLYNTNF